MEELDVPYAPQAARDVEDHAEHHHLSPWPLFLGLFAVPVLAIGVITFKGTGYAGDVILTIGAILTLMGLVGWVREDTLAWPRGPNPLTEATIGEKSTGWWGIWLFLATEVVLFGALFATYFASKAEATGRWPPSEIHLPVTMTAINTAILVTSGFVMHLGEVQLKKRNQKGFILGFLGAIILGTIFLVIQAYEYIELVHSGVTLEHGIFASTFFLLTGTHGVHVFGGLVFLSIVLARAIRGQFNPDRHDAVTAAAIYWHFVDIVWILLFAIVYLQVI